MLGNIGFNMSEEPEILKFERCPEVWRTGYLIPVRNRLNDMLQEEFLPEEYKEEYLDYWGDKIIYDDQFVDWYCELKRKK